MYGALFEDYQNFNMTENPSSLLPVEKTPAPTEKSPWYNNPGFWSEIGKVGSALLSGNPRLKGLSAAGEVASSYHNAKQLSNAESKMLSNVTAGNAPMTGFETADKLGLTPDQVSKLQESGLKEQERMSVEKSRKIGDDYKNALIKDMDEKRAAKELKIKNWKETITGWEDGTIKKPSFVPDDAVPLFKAMDADDAESLLKEMLKKSKESPNTQFVTDEKGRKIHMIDKDTRVKVGEIDMGAAPEDGASKTAKVGFLNNAKFFAFSEMLPALTAEFDKTMGAKPEAKAKYNSLLATFATGNDQQKESALIGLLGYAGDKLQKDFRDRTNQIDKSLREGKGVPDPVKGSGAVQDVTIKQKVDIKKLKEVGAQLTKDLKRPPTPTELQAAYEKALGGK